MFAGLIPPPPPKLCAFLLRILVVPNPSLICTACCTEENTKPPGSRYIALFVIQIPAQSAGLWIAVSLWYLPSAALQGLWQVGSGVRYRNFCFIQLSSHPTHLHCMGDSATSGSSQNTKTTKCLGWTFIYCNGTVIFQYEILAEALQDNLAENIRYCKEKTYTTLINCKYFKATTKHIS